MEGVSRRSQREDCGAIRIEWVKRIVFPISRPQVYAMARVERLHASGVVEMVNI